MSYPPMTREQIAAVMTSGQRPLTVAHFYDMIEESLNEPGDARQWPYYAMDFIDSPQAWETFKAAMTQWLEHHDRESQEGFAMAEAEEAYDREHRHLKPVRD